MKKNQLAALAFNITGNYNTVIGAGADASYSNLYNATAIGYNAIVDDFAWVWMGDAIINSIGGAKSRTTFSDGRFKKEIREDVKGLDINKELRPVSYIIDVLAPDKYYHQNSDTSAGTLNVNNDWQQAAFRKAAVKRETGFIAQEVEKISKETGYSFSGVDVPIDSRALYGLRYGDFVVPLVKAVQEQQQIIETQSKKIDLLIKEIQLIKEKMK